MTNNSSQCLTEICDEVEDCDVIGGAFPLMNKSEEPGTIEEVHSIQDSSTYAAPLLSRISNGEVDKATPIDPEDADQIAIDLVEEVLRRAFTIATTEEIIQDIRSVYRPYMTIEEWLTAIMKR